MVESNYLATLTLPRVPFADAWVAACDEYEECLRLGIDADLIDLFERHVEALAEQTA